MVEEYKILRIEDSISSISPGQIGVEVAAHEVLGIPAWGGKDYSGEVSRWAALDRNARFVDLTLTGTTTTGEEGILKHNAAGVVTGGQLTIEELNDLISDGPLGPAYWDRDVGEGYLFPVNVSDTIVIGDGAIGSPSIGFESNPGRGLYNITGPLPGVGITTGPGGHEFLFLNNEGAPSIETTADSFSVILRGAYSTYENYALSGRSYIGVLPYAINGDSHLRLMSDAPTPGTESKIQLDCMGWTGTYSGIYLQYELYMDDAISTPDGHYFKWSQHNSGSGGPGLREILRLYHDNNTTTYLQNPDDGSDYSHYNFVIRKLAGASGLDGVIRVQADGDGAHGAQVYLEAIAKQADNKQGLVSLNATGMNATLSGLAQSYSGGAANVNLQSWNLYTGGAANSKYETRAEGNSTSYLYSQTTDGNAVLTSKAYKDGSNYVQADMYLSSALLAQMVLESRTNGGPAYMTVKAQSDGENENVTTAVQAYGYGGGNIISYLQAHETDNEDDALCRLTVDSGSGVDAVKAELLASAYYGGDSSKITIKSSAAGAGDDSIIDIVTEVTPTGTGTINITAANTLNRYCNTAYLYADNRIYWGDGFIGGSTLPGNEIALATQISDYSNYYSNFGDVPIINAINQAYAAAGSVSYPDDTPLWFGTGDDSGFEWNTDQTNDSLLLGLGASNHIIICEKADMGVDFGQSNRINPTLVIQSADSGSPLEYVSVYHTGDRGVITTGAGFLATSEAGTPSQAATPGDFYVQDTLEVDGPTYLGTATITDARPTTLRMYDDNRIIFGTGSDAGLEWNTDQTNDSLLLGLRGSYTFIICDYNDMATDLGLSSRSTPTLAIFDVAGAQRFEFYHDGSAGNLYSSDNFYINAANNITLDPGGTGEVIISGPMDLSGNAILSGAARLIQYSGSTLFLGQDTGVDLTATIDLEAGTNVNFSINGSDIAQFDADGLEMNNFDLYEIKTATFNGIGSITATGSAATVAFDNYQKAYVDLNDQASVTITLNEPRGVGNYMLILEQGGSTPSSITWATEGTHAVRAPNGAISVATATGSFTMIGLYYDGTVWWVVSSQPMQNVIAS
jgi:hypothetical protein